MSCPAYLRLKILTAQHRRCWLCGLLREEHSSNASFHAHRIKPGRQGGLYEFGNVVLVGKECHIKLEGLSMSEILRLWNPYGEELYAKIVSEDSRGWEN